MSTLEPREYGFFLQTDPESLDGFPPAEVMKSLSRLLLRCALEDANDAESHGLLVDLRTVNTMTTEFNDANELIEGLGYTFTAVDPRAPDAKFGRSST